MSELVVGPADQTGGRLRQTFILHEPALVAPQVSQAKLDAELGDWQANAAIYARRGWVLLDRGPLQVEVAFIAAMPLVGVISIPVVTACVRLDFTNYDLWPPSLTFIDPRTREPARPAVRAPASSAAGVRDALIDGHPATGRPFLCLPGIREYHSHPQHTGDDWLLHRAAGAGRLAVICEQIWQRMARNVLGLRVTVQAFPPAIGTQVEALVIQGDVSVVEAALPVPASQSSDCSGNAEHAAEAGGASSESNDAAGA